MARRTPSRTWLRAAALAAVGLALVACGPNGGSGPEAQSRPARGIVVDLGGRLAVLDGLDAEPRVVGAREEDTEKFDGYHLTGVRQLDQGGIVGIRQGTAVAVSAQDPMRAILVAPATAIFPSADGRRMWTVTEEALAESSAAGAAGACPGEQLPATVRARYSAAEHDTDGRPARRTVALPCGYQPVAETVEGLVAEQTVGDRKGPSGAVARTRIVLLDRDGKPARTVADSGTVLAAAGRRLLWRGDDCADAACTQVYDTLSHGSAPAPHCAVGEQVGRGVLDPSGRWYATPVQAAGAVRIAVLDLEKHTCRDLGPTGGASTDPGASGGTQPTADLGDTLTVGWSGATLLVLDASDGTLHTLDGRTGATGTRSRPLQLGDGAQLWGALPA